MQKKFPDQQITLTDDDISSRRAVSRRSLLGSLGIGLGLAAAGIVANAGTARAQKRGPAGCTDRDSGPYEDPPGRGRRCRNMRYTGGTDNDRGPDEDPPGYGIGCWV
jgi:hypothetical protein